jgi:hypothetical protein
MALLWGLGLGLVDGAFFGLTREAYTSWLRMGNPNSTRDDLVRLYTLLGVAGAVSGLFTPLVYLWAAASVGSLVEVHIFRCIISVLISLLLGTMLFKDTINGFRALGVLFSMLGLVMILSSSAYATKN